MAEDYYQTKIMEVFTYLFCTWSLPAKCAKITSLFTTYEIIGRIRPFTPFRFIILFHFVCCPNWDFRYYKYSNCYFRHFESFRFFIFAILVIQNYYFPPSLLFIFQIYQSSNLIGRCHFGRLRLTHAVNYYQARY